MIIEPNFSKYIVFSEDSILNALNKISLNKKGIVFVASEAGVLEGALTDGDFRRWLLGVQHVDLELSVGSIMNANVRWASEHDAPEKINALLDDKYTAIPLVDSNKRIVSVAFGQSREIEISGRVISDDAPVFIIAEIGNNHNGSLELAKVLVDKAVDAGADCAKFQMRNMDALYKHTSSEGDASADLGTQYTLDLLSKFQLSDEELFEVFDYCKEKGIIPLCTPWDEKSLFKLEEYGLGGYKVASADFTNHGFIEALARTHKPLICSTGMTSENEIDQGIGLLKRLGCAFILLHCNSTYPAPFKDIHLSYMTHLRKKAGNLVGYSGHERDVYVAVAAVALGAKVIEKHFTLDRAMEGNDHKVSLLPEEFADMVKGIRQVELALGASADRKLTQGEMMNRENLAKSLIAATDITAGTLITADMIDVKSPGQGLQPNRRQELIGSVCKSPKKQGDYFFESDLKAERVSARRYNFPHKWGVPVRYHDLKKMLNMSNPDILEVHLSYKDMELDFRDYIEKPLDVGLVVHSPELFSQDHTLDLCSLDLDYRARSISELQRVIELTRRLSEYFSNDAPTCIVTNVGGFTHDGHASAHRVEQLYDILEESLAKLDRTGVEVIPQTMPPFPWHFGGQQFHNLFVDPDSIAKFCTDNGMRICLDTSHSMLACSHASWSFSSFVKKVAPFTAHMHLADSTGVDGEGIQIAEGDVDWAAFAELAREKMPNATFIPEIWQGHKNDGEGAWLALERLEGFFN